MTEPANSTPGRPLPLVAQIAIVVALTLACGTAANLLSPRRIAWFEDWSRYIETRALAERIPLATAEQAHRFVSAGSHLVLDARPLPDFEDGRLPGAHSVPYDDREAGLAQVQMFLTPAQPILTYCSGASCDESLLLTLHLRDLGFTNLVLFAGGFDAWRAAGFPVEGGP